MADGTAVECLVITQRDLDEYEESEAVSYYYYSPDHHRTVKMETADLSELDMEGPQTSYALTPKQVKTAQTFNAKYADPAKIGEDGDDDVNIFLIGGILALVPLAALLFFVAHKRKAGEGQPFQNGQGPQPFQAGGQPGFGPGMGQAQYQAAAPGYGGNYLCPTCSRPAEYIDAYQRHYCRGCQSYLPLYQAPQTTQPAQNQGPLPALSSSGAMVGAACKRCAGQTRYIPQYQRYYCDLCREYL